MIGFVRTRATAIHSPSPLIAGVTCGARSPGRGGNVVVVVVVVVVSPGRVDDVVVVVVVVVVVLVSKMVVVGDVVVVASTDGQLVVRTRDVCLAGELLPPGVVVVVDVEDEDSSVGVVLTGRVSVGGSVSTGEIKARVSAGAAAGGSL